MGLAHSPRVATNGLVFAFDRDNFKSYKGPAIQNIATDIVAAPSSGAGYSFTAGSESVNIPSLGAMSAQTITGYNNYPTSNNCCPSPFYYTVDNGSVACSPSTTYTYSIVYKTQTGYHHPNFMYRYEYSATDVYNGEQGVHNASNRIHLGDGWYWAWATFTTNPTTTKLYLRYFYYYHGTNVDKMWVAKVLVTPGTYTGLHPRYWPDVAATKSASNTFYDMMNNTTCSAAAPLYASDGSFSFDGNNNYIRFNNTTALDTQTPTVEVWMKTNATTQNGFWFEKGSVNTQYSLFQEVANIVWRQKLAAGLTSLTATTASYVSTNNWAHIVGTYTSGDRKLYVNGVLVSSDATSGVIDTNASGLYIGEYGADGYRYNGSIGIVNVYNRVLSAAEVRQNFNALRGRFGI